MACKLETRLTTESSDWHPVIDMKLSKTKRVDRVFLDEEDAADFAKKTLNLKEDLYRVIEAEPIDE